MDKTTKDLDAFEAKLRSALKATGHLFPTTDGEMEYFLEHATMGTIPEKYQILDFIFDEDGSIPVKRVEINKVDYAGTAQSWGLAARNGRELPPSILEKMKEDKKNSLKK